LGWTIDLQRQAFESALIDDSTGLHFIQLSGIPGQYYHIDSYDRFVYLGGGGGVRIIDITNPKSPIQISQIQCGYAASMFFKDGFLYVAHIDSFSIYDISDISTPIFVGKGGLNTASITDIYVRDNYAFLAAWWAIAAFDVGDPTQPLLVDTLNTPGYALNIEVSGNYAYVADAFCVTAVDITDPSAMSVASVISDSHTVDDIKIKGNYAFYTAGADSLGIKVADISNPHNIRQVAGAEIGGVGSMIDINGNYAFVTCTYQGIRAINITNALNPFLVASSTEYGRVMDVAAFGQYAFAGCNDSLKVLLLTVNCSDIAGDADGDGTLNGIDVIYSVNYLKGIGSSPCPSFCEPPVGTLFKDADSNGSCSFNGVDVTYTVNYLKYGLAIPVSCPDCNPTKQY
jgi:hypothetical protein